ncbi:MAG: hypothetical protein HYV93_01135 [Candidatus Rokubacteria bacterium]|nr:hypothetical protein [Candidatus Rokubacteria bacterium]
MTPTAEIIIVVCVVAVAAALVSTLMTLKKAAARAETVLHLLEREIRPMAGQLGALAEELRGLSRQATREMERISVVIRRAEEISAKLVKAAGVLGGIGRIGQIAAVAAGVRKGLDVFVSRLRSRDL